MRLEAAAVAPLHLVRLVDVRHDAVPRRARVELLELLEGLEGELVVEALEHPEEVGRAVADGRHDVVRLEQALLLHLLERLLGEALLVARLTLESSSVESST